MLLRSAVNSHLKTNEQTFVLVTIHTVNLTKTIICWGAFLNLFHVRQAIGFDDQKLSIPNLFLLNPYIENSSASIGFSMTNGYACSWHLSFKMGLVSKIKEVSMLWSRKVQTKGWLTITIIKELIWAPYVWWEDTVLLLHGKVDIDDFNTKMLSSFGVGCGHMGNKVLLNLDLGFLIIWSNSLGESSRNVVAMIMW